MNERDDAETHETLYIYKHIRDALLKINSDKYHVTDVLVKYLYKKNRNYKETLWKTFGDVIVENIKRNLDGTKQCEMCGKRIEVTSSTKKYCNKCWEIHRKKYKAEKEKEYRRKKRGQTKKRQSA